MYAIIITGTMTIAKFQQKILAWYRKNRRDLPWRRTRDPYKILVSEVMLQQTQIARVIPKYQKFLRVFPTCSSLAKAPCKSTDDKVIENLGRTRLLETGDRSQRKRQENRKRLSQEVSERCPRTRKTSRRRPLYGKGSCLFCVQ